MTLTRLMMDQIHGGSSKYLSVFSTKERAEWDWLINDGEDDDE